MREGEERPDAPVGAPLTVEAGGLGRRAFLRRSMAGAALLLVGGTALRHLGGYRVDPETERRLRVLSVKEAVVLGAVARRMLAPDERGAPTPDEVGVVTAVDDYLRALPPAAVSDVRALLQLVEHSPLLFTGRPSRFTRLDPDGQDALLRDWERSRIALRRRGFVALKTLCVLGYYGDPRTHAVLDYPGPTLPRG